MSVQPKEEKKEESQGKSWPRAVGWSLVLVAIFSLPVYGVMFGTSESTQTQSSRPTLASSPTRTPAPSPTLTFAQWESKSKSISYDALARSPASHEGEVVRFRGQVAHIASETSDYVELWVYVARDSLTGSWREDKLVLHCRDLPYRVLEDDMISFVAIADGIDPVHHIPALLAVALEVE